MRETRGLHVDELLAAGEPRKRRWFGTDGVRGVVGDTLTPQLVERLGRAVTLWSGRGRVLVPRGLHQASRFLEDFRWIEKRKRIHACSLPDRRRTLNPTVIRKARLRTAGATASSPYRS